MSDALLPDQAPTSGRDWLDEGIDHRDTSLERNLAEPDPFLEIECLHCATGTHLADTGDGFKDLDGEATPHQRIRVCCQERACQIDVARSDSVDDAGNCLTGLDSPSERYLLIAHVRLSASLAAASSGSSAFVTARPTTSRSAPPSRATWGVADRA